MDSCLVTGASGFFGYHICRHLVALGCRVRGLDVTPFDYPDLAADVEFFEADIRDAAVLKRAMRDVGVVVHAAAALPLQSASRIRAVNVAGTDTVLASALELGVRRLIYISSTAVYGIPRSHPVTEDHPLVGIGPYGETKIAAEALCRRYREMGLGVTILRPRTFAGPKRLGVFQILCDWVREGRDIPIIGSGGNRYQLLHVDDLVQITGVVAQAEAALADGTFNVGAAVFGTMREDLQELLDYAAHGGRVRPVPAGLVIPALRALEFLHLSPLYEWVYETADKEHYVSLDKLRQRFNWQPRKSSAAVWIDTYRWYVEEFAGLAVTTGTGHRIAWKQGVLGLVKRFF